MGLHGAAPARVRVRPLDGVGLVGVVLSLQHLFFSMRFGWRSDLWLAVKFLPFALWTGFVDRRQTAPRYLLVLHALIDVTLPVLLVMVGTCCSADRRGPAARWRACVRRTMAILSSPHLLLPDGRRLACREFGATSGRPLLYFHGTPASKHNGYLGHDAEALERLGIRAFVIDRPGIGGSDPQPGRTRLS